MPKDWITWATGAPKGRPLRSLDVGHQVRPVALSKLRVVGFFRGERLGDSHACDALGDLRREGAYAPPSIHPRSLHPPVKEVHQHDQHRDNREGEKGEFDVHEEHDDGDTHDR